MIKINLLPYREKAKKENVTRQISIMVGSFVIFLLAIIAFHLWLSGEVSSLENEVGSSEARLTVLNKQIGDVDKFKKDKKELEQKLDVIKTLEENRLAPVRLLDDLALLVPQKDIWFVRLEQKGDSLKIDGVGRDNMAVADFMKSMENFSPVKSVELISSKKKEIAGITLQEFRFSCVMKKGF